MVVSWCRGRVLSLNDVIQMIEKTLNNTHTIKQKQTNNGFRDTKKHRANSSLNDARQLEAFLFRF